MKRLRTTALLIIILVAMTGCFSEETSIKIGAILPLTGSASLVGEEVRDGILVAVNEINMAGGINERQIELFVDDSESNPIKGVNAYNNLVNLNNPNIVITALSSVSSSLAPIANERKIPLLTLVTTVPELTNEWTFRYYSTANEEITPIIKIAEDLKIKKFAVLYLNDDFGQGMFNTLKERFSGDVFGESYLSAAKDFKTELLKLKSKDPDAILVIGFNSHIINAINQITEIDLDALIFAPSTASLQSVRSSIRDTTVYFGAPSIYKGNVNKSHYFYNGYDAIILLKSAVENSENSKEGIKNGLEEINEFDGKLGELVISRRDFRFALYPAKIENGKIIFI